jgi:hypothetical protein
LNKDTHTNIILRDAFRQATYICKRFHPCSQMLASTATLRAIRFATARARKVFACTDACEVARAGAHHLRTQHLRCLVEDAVGAVSTAGVADKVLPLCRPKYRVTASERSLVRCGNLPRFSSPAAPHCLPSSECSHTSLGSYPRTAGLLCPSCAYTCEPHDA